MSNIFRQVIYHTGLAIPIDEKFEYGIWVSYAEIYTEKIYDLLVPPDKQLKRKQLSLKYEFRSGHKYISGLKEVKVQNIEVCIMPSEITTMRLTVHHTGSICFAI